MKYFCLVIVSIFILSSDVMATDGLNYDIRHDYISPRALGMGDAFIAMADDYNTLFYNPAGLHRLKKNQLSAKLMLGATPEINNFMNDVKSANGQSDDQKPIAFSNLVQNNFGKDYWVRPSAGAVWAGHDWGVAFIPVDLSVDLSVHQTLGASLNIEAYQDSTIAFGLAKGFGPGEQFSMGITPKIVYRGYVGKAVQASELAISSDILNKADSAEGMTVDADLGLLWVPPPPSSGLFHFTNWARPSFGAVLRNAADYGFKKNYHFIDANSGEPPKLDRRLDLGMKLQTDHFWIFQPQFEIDERDIGHKYFTFLKGLHVGTELLWDVAWWLKGGYSIGVSEGYLSLGASAQLSWFRAELATWGEEIGTSGAHKQNRRWILQASLNF